MCWRARSRVQENISAYLKAARAFGQIEFELFDTNDLAGKKNIKSVISSLHSLGRVTQEKRPELLKTLSIKVVRGVRGCGVASRQQTVVLAAIRGKG